MIYQLSYELRTGGKSYTDFYTYLENGLGGSAIHILRDVWWIAVEGKTLDELLHSIKDFFGEDDIFFITAISAESTNGWMPKSVGTWLEEHKN